jgi:multisubunit Na+/H+ antiporter MnhB subunit
MDTLTTVATAFANHWQNGSLRWYFTGTWLFVSTLGVFALYRGGIGIDNVPLSLAGAPWYGVALCGLLIIAAVAVARATTRIAAAIAITATGYLTALLFVVYRSPDIVLTQILIETVSTIFVLLILYFMPAWKPDKLLPAGRLMNVVVACIVGVVMFLFTVVATSDQFRETRNLAGSYLTRAYADANGHNAVNVIIVDFRAIDTTGEITVLVVVGLLIYGLLRSRRTMT